MIEAPKLDLTWWKAKWEEITTKIGAVITGASTALSAVQSTSNSLVGLNPKWAYVGALIGVLLVLFKEKKSA